MNNLLTSKQFSFRHARSTSLALTQFTDKVSTNLDEGLVNGIVFIDLKNAFDTVDHIMLNKLKSVGIDSLNLAWFHSYLPSHSQKTVIGQASSGMRKVTVGVPQDSIFGLLLFTLYINDLPNSLHNTDVTLFADTALHCSCKSAVELQSMLNQDFKKLV